LADFLDTSRIVNGHYGYLYLEGEWQTNVTAVTADVEPDYKEVLVCGTRWTQHKLGSLKGTGTITGFKVTLTSSSSTCLSPMTGVGLWSRSSLPSWMIRKPSVMSAFG